MVIADIETNGLCPTVIYGVGWRRGSESGWLDLHWHIDQEHIDYTEIDKLLGHDEVVFHNAKYDVKVLRRFGYNVPAYHCSYVAGWCLNPNMRKYKATGKHESAFALWAWGQRLGMPKLEPPNFDEWNEALIPYCLRDVEVTAKVWEFCSTELRKDPEAWEHYLSIELPLIDILIEMEDVGLPVDLEQLSVFGEVLDAKIVELDEKVSRLVPYVLGAKGYHKSHHNERTDIVYTGNVHPDKGYEYRKKIPFRSSDTTKTHIIDAYSRAYGIALQDGTSTTLAEHSDKELTQLLLDGRECGKLYGTYVLPFTECWDNGYVHGNINQGIALTGRLTSSNPNLQNIPTRTDLGSELRKVVRTPSPNWKLVGIDLSNIEYRVLFSMMASYYTNRTGSVPKDVQFVIDSFNNGEDYHDTMCRLWFREVQKLPSDDPTFKKFRKRGKNISFARVFGAGIGKTALQMGCSYAEAKRLRDMADEYNPSFNQFREWVLDEYRASGGVNHTIYGRRLIYPNFRLDPYSHSPQYLPSENITVQPSEVSDWISRGERQGFNAKIQGSASDVIKILTVAVTPTLHTSGGVWVVQVHDEDLALVPTERADYLAEKFTRAFTQEPGTLLPYVAVEGTAIVGDSWYECK